MTHFSWLSLVVPFVAHTASAAAQAAPGAKATAASPTNVHVIERDPRAPQLFLNELLFAPRANESAFVEIVNAGSRELPVAGLSLVGGSNEKFVLPNTVGPIAPGGRLLAEHPVSPGPITSR